VQLRHRGVHRQLVLGHHVGALAGVRLADGLLDLLDRRLAGHHVADREEAGLQHRVGAPSHPGLAGHHQGVDRPQFDAQVDDPLLHRPRQHLEHRLRRVGGVHQQDRPGPGELQDIHPLQDRPVVAADEAGLVHQVRRLDRLGSEPQMRHRARAGLLGVVDEIALGVGARDRAQDLDGVLVGAHGPVRSQAVEHRPQGRGIFDVEVRVVGQGGQADVVVDSDGEPRTGGVPVHLVEDPDHHPRGEFLAGQAVTPTDDHRHGRAPAGRVGLAEGGGDVEEQGLAARTGLFGAVEDGHGGDAGGDRRQHLLDRERPVQPEVHHADPFTRSQQVVDGLADGLGTRPHDHDHPVGLRVAVVVDQVVAPAGAGREGVHRLADHARDRGVERVDGFPGLEVGVGVLGGAADVGVLGGERPPAVGPYEVVGDQSAQVVVGEHLHHVDLVAGAETVEEVHERDAGPQGGDLGDRGQVVRLLHRSRRQHREPGLPYGHHVLVVAVDAQPLGGQRPRGHVEHGGGELAGNFVHIGDHQQQPLRGSEGGAQRAGLQRAVYSTGGAALRLHLDHCRHGAPQVAHAGSHPGIGKFAHARGGGDGVNRDDFRQAVSDIRHRFVGVYSDQFSFHVQLQLIGDRRSALIVR